MKKNDLAKSPQMNSPRDPLVYRAELLLSRVPRTPSKEVKTLVRAIKSLLPVCESAIREGRLIVLRSGEPSFAVRRSLLNAELADVLMTPDEVDYPLEQTKPPVEIDLEMRAKLVKHAEFRHLVSLFCAEVKVVCDTMIEAITKRWPENALLGMARQLQKVAALFYDTEKL